MNPEPGIAQSADKHSPESGSGMARVLERNIQTLIDRREEEERNRPLADKVADSITRFTGSMLFVVLHVGIFGLWIIVNLRWIPGIKPFDPSFVILAMVASVEAIFLSTFVLITQNRMAEMAGKRADLDVQIGLLAEHEVTRTLNLVRAIARQMGIEESHDPELNELSRDVQPEKVLDHIDKQSRG